MLTLKELIEAAIASLEAKRLAEEQGDNRLTGDEEAELLAALEQAGITLPEEPQD